MHCLCGQLFLSLLSNLVHLILWKILKLILVAPSGEDEEVRTLIRECLALRVKYVYRENVVPWMNETVTDDSPKMDHDPFRFDDVEPTAVSCFSFTSDFQSFLEQNFVPYVKLSCIFLRSTLNN